MLTAAFSYYLDCDGASRKKGCVHSRSKADLLGATADVEKQRRTSSSAASRSVNVTVAGFEKMSPLSTVKCPPRTTKSVAMARVGPPPGMEAGRLSAVMLDARRVAVAGLSGCTRDGPVIALLQAQQSHKTQKARQSPQAGVIAIVLSFGLGQSRCPVRNWLVLGGGVSYARPTEPQRPGHPDTSN